MWGILAYTVALPKNIMWRGDMTNRFKPVFDTIADVIAIDDRYQVYLGNVTKIMVDKELPFISGTVIIWPSYDEFLNWRKDQGALNDAKPSAP